MDLDALHLLIAQKLADGRLPQEIPSRISGLPAHGEPCDACEGVIEPAQFVMRGGTLQFHVDCLFHWDVARQAPPAPTDKEPVARS